MPNEILVITATLAARTPAAPLMPQNQGVGRRSTFETKRIPVGKPNPMKKPAGVSTRTANPARIKRSALSR